MSASRAKTKAVNDAPNARQQQQQGRATDDDVEPEQAAKRTRSGGSSSPTSASSPYGNRSGNKKNALATAPPLPMDAGKVSPPGINWAAFSGATTVPASNVQPVQQREKQHVWEMPAPTNVAPSSNLFGSAFVQPVPAAMAVQQQPTLLTASMPWGSITQSKVLNTLMGPITPPTTPPQHHPTVFFPLQVAATEQECAAAASLFDVSTTPPPPDFAEMVASHPPLFDPDDSSSHGPGYLTPKVYFMTSQEKDNLWRSRLGDAHPCDILQKTHSEFNKAMSWQQDLYNREYQGMRELYLLKKYHQEKAVKELNHAEETRREAVEARDRMSKELEEEIDEHHAKESDLREVKVTIGNLETDLAHEKGLVDFHKGQVAEYRKMVDEGNAQMEDCLQFGIENTELKKEVAELKNSLAAREGNDAQWKSAYDTLSNEKEWAEHDLKKAKAELEKLRPLEAENAELKWQVTHLTQHQQLDSMNLQSMHKRVKHADYVMKRAKEFEEAATKRIEGCKLEDRETLESANEVLVGKLTAAEKERDDATAKLEKVESEVATKIQKIQGESSAKIEKVKGEAAAQLEKVKSEAAAKIEKIESEAVTSKAKIDELEGENVHLIVKVEMLNKRLERREAELKDADKMLDDANESYDKIVKINDELRDALNQACLLYSDKMKESAEAKREVEKLKKELETVRVASDNGVSGDDKAFLEKIAALEKELETARAGSNYTDVKALLEQILALQEQKQEAERVVSALQLELNDIKVTIGNHEIVITALKDEHVKDVELLKRNYKADAHTAKQNYEKIIKDLREKVKLAVQSNAVTETKIGPTAQVKAVLDHARAELVREQQRYRDDFSEYRKDKSRVQEKANAHESTSASLVLEILLLRKKSLKARRALELIRQREAAQDSEFDYLFKDDDDDSGDAAPASDSNDNKDEDKKASGDKKATEDDKPHDPATSTGDINNESGNEDTSSDSKVTGLENEVADLKIQNSNLTTALNTERCLRASDAKESKLTISMLEVQNKDLTEDLKWERMDHDATKKDLSAANTLRTMETQAKIAATKQRNDFEAEVDRLNEELVDTKAAEQSTFDELEAEKAARQETKIRWDEKEQELTKKIEELERKVAGLKPASEEWEKEKRELQKKIKEMQLDLDCKDEEILGWSDSHLALSDERCELEEKVEELKVRLKELGVKLDDKVEKTKEKV